MKKSMNHLTVILLMFVLLIAACGTVKDEGPPTGSGGGGDGDGTPGVTAEAASIEFVSAAPQLLGIKGSGQNETSLVYFKVYDTNGDSVTDGVVVTFELQGPGGSEFIGSTPGSLIATGSTSHGAATIMLNSGNVAGPVTIIASIQLTSGAIISTSATQISIGGGVPSAGRWNLASSKFNLAGLSYLNLQATISVFIADRFGNYNILKGTAISFYPEAGGAIDTQGITLDDTGTASVIIRTQDAPADVSKWLGEPWYSSGTGTYTHTYNPRDGWVTVLATTMGEEAFLDENGDGLFTLSYSATPCPVSPPGYICEIGVGGLRSEAFKDLGEPFYDINDNGTRDDGSVVGSPFEEFFDGNNNKVYDGPNGVWDGPGCQSTGCLNSKMIWQDIRLVFTSAVFTFWPDGDINNCYVTDAVAGCSATFANSNASYPFSVAPPSIAPGGNGFFCVNIADYNLNSPPSGVVLTAAATVGTVTPTSITLLDGLSYGPATFCFNVAIATSVTDVSTMVSVGIKDSATQQSLLVPIL